MVNGSRKAVKAKFESNSELSVFGRTFVGTILPHFLSYVQKYDDPSNTGSERDRHKIRTAN